MQIGIMHSEALEDDKMKISCNARSRIIVVFCENIIFISFSVFLLYFSLIFSATLSACLSENSDTQLIITFIFDFAIRKNAVNPP